MGGVFDDAAAERGGVNNVRACKGLFSFSSCVFSAAFIPHLSLHSSALSAHCVIFHGAACAPKNKARPGLTLTVRHCGLTGRMQRSHHTKGRGL